jgi:hypothetical protein
MIGVKPIVSIISYALATGKVKNENPVSILLIAPVEAGKTEILKKFSEVRGAIYITDLTLWGLYDLAVEIKSEKIHHIIVPDLLKLIYKKYSTALNLITGLNNLLTDGELNIKVYGRQERYTNLRCGLITAIPPTELRDKRHKWSSIGFLSRLLPVSYSYSSLLVEHIFDFIINDYHLNIPKEELDLPEEPVEVHIDPWLANKLVVNSRVLAEAQKLYGFRLQGQLQGLAKGRALLQGRDKVMEEDIQEIKELTAFINFDLTPLRPNLIKVKDDKSSVWE